MHSLRDVPEHVLREISNFFEVSQLAEVASCLSKVTRSRKSELCSQIRAFCLALQLNIRAMINRRLVQRVSIIIADTAMRILAIRCDKINVPIGDCIEQCVSTSF